MKILCVIPARYASTRLPGKPLADIAGKPMVVRVYNQVVHSKLATDVIVAVDDERVLEAVHTHGGKAMMTSPEHPTGTDRLAEVALEYPDVDVVINVQGDEPLIEPELIDRLAQCFIDDPKVDMATVKTPLAPEDIDNPSNVKVITDQQNFAIYFSRSVIPYKRNTMDLPIYKHIGIYGYRRNFLLQYAAMDPTPLEEAESLEQLRAIENGYKIKVIDTPSQFVGVDTPEDLEKVRAIFEARLQQR